MKKLIIPLFLLCLPFSSQAQDTIRIPVPVAKEIVKDLIKGDSVKAELGLIKQRLTLTEDKVTVRDSIIKTYQYKVKDYLTQISSEQAKANYYQKEYKSLAKTNKKLQAKLTFTRVSTGILVGILTYMYITK